MSATRSTSRRDFLRKCLTGAAVLGASGRVELLVSAEQQQQQQGAALAKSRVVVAHDAALRGTGATVDSHRMLSLLDRSMQALLDRDNPIETWKKLVHPGETVGLKVNTLGGRGRLQQPSTRRSHLRAVAGSRHPGERHRGLGPRQRRDGTRRIPFGHGRKPGAMLRHRPRRLRAGAGLNWQRRQPVVQDTDPPLRRADQCSGAERP